MKKSLVAGAALLALCAACGKKEEPVQEGKELSKNPIAAFGQVQDAVKKATDAAKEAENQKPVDPVHFSKLIELLPAPPSGWKVEGEPKGETASAMGFKISDAERSYSSGDAGKSAHVKIVDGAYNTMMYAGITMAAQFSRESTEGYEKGVTIAGNPGIEKWSKASKNADLSILVGKRFLVEINGRNVEPETVKQFYSAIDTAKLAALK